MCEGRKAEARGGGGGAGGGWVEGGRGEGVSLRHIVKYDLSRRRHCSLRRLLSRRVAGARQAKRT